MTPSSTELESFQFTVPGISLAKNSVELATFMVSVRVAVPVPAALVALSVTLALPAVVGVPEITPVVVPIDSPAGRPVALKLFGLFVAAMM